MTDSPGPQGLAAVPHRQLAGLSDHELLVTRYRDLVRTCVQRYLHSPEPAEDLMQVGYAGLVAAISNFDPAAGCALATFAHAHITGEIKRCFRDKRWPLHVGRPVKDLALRARTLGSGLTPGTYPRGRTSSGPYHRQGAAQAAIAGPMFHRAGWLLPD